MGFISGLFSGDKGANFQAQGATGAQADQSYANTQDALNKQNAFLAAVNGANGVGNQSQVYNQLQGVVNGTGPNPAQAMLNQATGQNVANQAALAAGVRGAGANAGMVARQAAQAGAAAQQQAVGQGATMQANQSLNALGQAGAMANNQANQQAQAVQGLNAAAQGQQANVLGSIANQNTANAGVAAQNAKGQGNLISGLAGAAGTVLGLADGGMVPAVVPAAPAPATMPAGPRSGVARFLGALAPTQAPASDDAAMQAMGANIGKMIGAGVQGAGRAIVSNVAGDTLMAQGGQVPAPQPTPQPQPKTLGQTIGFPGSNSTKNMSRGGKVPGQASVPGNSIANDTVPARLSPGEVVIPRSVMQSPDPVRGAAAFIQAVMAKQGMQRKA